MHNFTVAITYGSEIYNLQSSHHQAIYVRSVKGKTIPVADIVKNAWLKIIWFYQQRYVILTFNKHLQYKNYCTKLNN
jgi:hypothetical protein